MTNKYYNHDDPFTPGTTVRSDAANSKFDAITSAFEQAEIDTNRSIKFSAGETFELTEGPAARANKAIGFDADGNLILQPGAGKWTGNYQGSKIYSVRDIFRDAAGVLGLNNLYIVTKNFVSTNLAADTANFELLINLVDVETAKAAAQAARDSAQTFASNSQTSANNSASSATASANSATNSANSASFATTEANRATTEANRAAAEADAAAASAASVDETRFVTTDTVQTVGGTKTFTNPITASVNGNASTASTLQTARTINGVSFNGGSNITITANTPQALTFGSGLTSSGTTFNGSSARTLDLDGTVVRTSGNQSIGGTKTFTEVINGSISGNAATVGGVAASQFLRSDEADVKTSGALTFNDSVLMEFGTAKDADFFSNGVNFYLDLNAGAANFIIRDASTTRFTFAKATGTFTATGNVTAYSDIRVKENIERIDNALEKVGMLNGCTFDRTDVETARQTGLIAQEVRAVLPEAVVEADNGILTVAYGNMVGLLVEAIKELNQKVAELEARV